MVYYRKYRPQTIAELDSTKVRETLSAVLSYEDIPHAFLLTGPKGLGKTSTARIIAKVVNCENRKKGSIEPCNTCDSCVSITNGTNIDVLEIDGASNRGIDEIRDLRDKVKLAPSRAKKKVYIIDEVHMLTTEAFNALLKTIEEPPAHVMFLFATTEPHKVPDTILSRCFHVAFAKATPEEIRHSLERIVKNEDVQFESKKDKEKILSDIAKRADGGFRDATKLLEEIVIISQGKPISEAKVVNVYKTLNLAASSMVFFESLRTKNPEKIFKTIQSIVDAGVDMKVFLVDVLESLHTLLIRNINGQVQNYNFDLPQIKSLIELFSQAYQDTKYAVIPQLPLELAVVEWCSQTDDTNRHPELDSGSQQKDSGSESGMTDINIRNDKVHTMDSLLKKEKNMKVQAVLRGDKEEKVVVKKSDDSYNQEKLTEKQVAERLMDNLIFKVKPYNHSVAGVLRGCSITLITDIQVIFTTAYKFHKEKLEEIKTKQVLEQALKEITGKNLKVMIELKS